MDLYDLDKEQPRVLIIGAGVGGLTAAVALKTKLNFRNFIIVEKSDDIGGTWHENKYPGCSSDVHIHFYSLSTDLNPNWLGATAYHDEIKAYWSNIAKKYGLYSHLSLNTSVVKAEWKNDKELWEVTVVSSDGKAKTSNVNVIISAAGLLHVPRVPKFAKDGMGKFKGPVFHSARWRDDIDLKGRSVGVVGNGASAAQFIPYISEDPSTQVTHFCRTPNWFIPGGRQPYSKLLIWMLNYIPFFVNIWRFLLFLAFEFLYFAVFSGSLLPNITKMVATYFMTASAPKKYHDQLIPKYTIGCKRIIFDAGYLNSLHRPNVVLNWDGVASLDERGVTTTLGEHHNLDILILATGFITDEYPIEVKGVNGQTIQEYYDSQNGPKAYLGTTIPGFPNFCLLAGPNTATGHTSVIFFEEVQIDYALQLIKPILHHAISSFNVTTAATDAYNDKIQGKLAKSVFVGCSSWYKKDGTGKISSIFPGNGTMFWWRLRKPDWSHYNCGVLSIYEKRQERVVDGTI